MLCKNFEGFKATEYMCNAYASFANFSAESNLHRLLAFKGNKLFAYT
jgi:hypothetical protein